MVTVPYLVKGAAPVTPVPVPSGPARAGGRRLPKDEADLKLDADCVDWLRRMRVGDERALAALYDATISRVYGLALRIVRKPELAEEVCEDVYMQAWRDAGRYDPTRGRALTWMLVICRSRALDFLRRDDEAEATDEIEEIADRAGAEEIDPSDLLTAAQRKTALHAALKTLTPIQRQLVALAFFRGLTHEEIAAHAELPLGTVKTHLRKALASLRAALLDEVQPETAS